MESGQVAPKTSRQFLGRLAHFSGQLVHCSGQLAHSPGPLEKIIFCALLT